MAELLERLRGALGDKYRVERELGGGWMSRVFVAEDLQLGRKVVLKVLPPELAAGLSVERFHREIHLAAQLQHPNVVPLHAAGQADALLYYTMPLVEGESLRARLEREGELPIPESVRLLRDVADALAYAHEHGVIHRDVKPDNVLVSGHHALVTDFGVARAIASGAAAQESGETLTVAGMALGTPAYMAPEQAVADPHLDHRVDIYAFGVLAYEMLSATLPFAGPTPQAVLAAQVSRAPEPLSLRRPTVSPALATLVMRCLEKRPADRWQSAQELLAQLDELATTARDTTISPVTPVSVPRHRFRFRWIGAGLAGLVLIVIGFGLSRLHRHLTLDADLVAVAPFDVLDQRLALWREGLVDLLSRSLDGAGPLRTVAPSVVVRRWTGRADPASAAALAQRTGAGLVVFGTAVGSGPDSVRLTAALLDARTGQTVTEIDRRGAADRFDQLADSVAVVLLTELDRIRHLGAFRLGALGTQSVPALKSFLQGEQFYRRAEYDSALAYYRQAIGLDNNFTLALRRMSSALGWAQNPYDSLVSAYALRAGAHNHGLPPRDSLLTAIDSQFTALFSFADTGFRALQRRVFRTLDVAVRRYPEDPEGWYGLGEVRQHFGYGGDLSATDRETLDAFDRAISLDSGFAPAYEHAVQLALDLDGPAAARRYARAMLAHGGPNASSGGALLVLAALENDSAPVHGLDRMMDSASWIALSGLHLTFWNATDSAEAAIKALRSLLRARHSRGLYGEDSVWTDSALRLWLAFRGHVREACSVPNPSALVWRARPRWPDCALLGLVPADSASAIMRSWVRQLGNPGPLRYAAYETLRWWAAQANSGMLEEIAEASAGLERNSNSPVVREQTRCGRLRSEAYLPLSRADSAEALRRFSALPDTMCHSWDDRFVLAQLLAARGENKGALRVLREGRPGGILKVFWKLAEARAADRLGERDGAASGYRFVAAAWRNGDPEVGPYVAEAKEGLQRLSAEPAPAP